MAGGEFLVGNGTKPPRDGPVERTSDGEIATKNNCE